MYFSRSNNIPYNICILCIGYKSLIVDHQLRKGICIQKFYLILKNFTKIQKPAMNITLKTGEQ